MAAGPLFAGLLGVLWLSLCLAGWLIATLRFRPEASFLALGAAIVAGMAGAVLPALVGWQTLPGFLAGLALALVCSTAAAWQTMLRIIRPREGNPPAARPRDRV
jgi:hypothetical protein